MLLRFWMLKDWLEVSSWYSYALFEKPIMPYFVWFYSSMDSMKFATKSYIFPKSSLSIDPDSSRTKMILLWIEVHEPEEDL